MGRKSQYDILGVSSQKSGVHRAVRTFDPGIYPDAFCKILEDHLGGDPDYCNVIHADTAGTKASLAYLYAKVTGDLKAILQLPSNSLEMNFGDVECIGATGEYPILVSSTIGRNKKKFTDEYLQPLLKGTEVHLQKLRELGMKVYSGGGETADVGDLVRAVDIGHTIVTRMPRKDVIRINIQPGDAIVALASDGQALYENEPNSGLASNGYTLARHGVLDARYGKKYPETFDTDLPARKVYRGSLLLTDEYPGLPLTVGQALLSPTRSMAPVLRSILENREGIHGIIHNTGGAHEKVNGFLPGSSNYRKSGPKIQVVKDNLFRIPPVFTMIKRESNTTWHEMFQVFNCGALMELYVTPDRVDDIVASAAAFGIAARQIGECYKAEKSGVTIRSPFGTFTYPVRKRAA